MRKPLSRYRRVVIKIGSALLVDRKTGLKKAWLDAMCRDIAGLKAKGVEFTEEVHEVRAGVRICFIRGPQGISIELIERT